MNLHIVSELVSSFDAERMNPETEMGTLQASTSKLRLENQVGRCREIQDGVTYLLADSKRLRPSILRQHHLLTSSCGPDDR